MGPIFFWKSLGVSQAGRNIIWPISGRIMEISADDAFHILFRGQKWRFFSIFAKCFLIMFRYQILVQNGFRTSGGPISGHISHFRPLLDNIGKIEKNDFFDIFAKFTCAILCILWPGPAGSGRGYQWSPKTHSSESLDAFSYLYRYHDSSRSKVIAIWKIRILLNFTTLRNSSINLSTSWNSPKFEIFKLQ